MPARTVKHARPVSNVTGSGAWPTVVTPEHVDDVDDVVHVLVGSFYNDPLWSWALPDPSSRSDQQRRLWRLCVVGAIRYPWVWLTEGSSATSVWIPPDGTEFPDEQVERLEPILEDMLGHDAARVVETFDLFEQAHPRTVPHFYLSLLGTDPRQAGHGYGLGLLADNLRRIDELGAPAYLEASNTANVPLYQRYGFEVVGSFRPLGGPEVVTMWRTPRSPA